jgi:hypothetical protein
LPNKSLALLDFATLDGSAGSKSGTSNVDLIALHTGRDVDQVA